MQQLQLQVYLNYNAMAINFLGNSRETKLYQNRTPDVSQMDILIYNDCLSFWKSLKCKLAW